jgi:hypothetical protein
MMPAFIAAVVVLVACTRPSTEKEPPFEFGKLRARLNGSDFVGGFTRDSIIAIYSPGQGQVEIIGEKQVRGRKPSVRVFMRCAIFPKAGTYPIGGMRTPVYMEAFLEPSAWERAWPLQRREIHSFLSDSMPSGSLELDTIDTVGGVIKGRFAAALRSVNRLPAETLKVHGAFFGRIHMERRFGDRGLGGSPLFDLDCERIRNALGIRHHLAGKEEGRDGRLLLPRGE